MCTVFLDFFNFTEYHICLSCVNCEFDDEKPGQDGEVTRALSNHSLYVRYYIGILFNLFDLKGVALDQATLEPL